MSERERGGSAPEPRGVRAQSRRSSTTAGEEETGSAATAHAQRARVFSLAPGVASPTSIDLGFDVNLNDTRERVASLAGVHDHDHVHVHEVIVAVDVNVDLDDAWPRAWRDAPRA